MSQTSGVHVPRRYCRDCRFWYFVSDLQNNDTALGNCRRHPWPGPRWAVTATASCHDFIHHLAYQTERR